MAKTVIPDEVQVLRFFEQGSIEKAEVLFNIVSDKMRERLRIGEGSEGTELPPSGAAEKRQPAGRKAQAKEVREPNPAE